MLSSNHHTIVKLFSKKANEQYNFFVSTTIFPLEFYSQILSTYKGHLEISNVVLFANFLLRI